MNIDVNTLQLVEAAHHLGESFVEGCIFIGGAIVIAAFIRGVAEVLR